MDNTFLEHASNVLGDTNGGLSDSEINKYILEYAVSNNVSLPNNKEYPNKRTKLFEYLKKFDTKSCVNIIYKLTLLDKFNNNDAVTKLREQLISKYGQYIDNKVTDTVIVQQTKHWLENFQMLLSLIVEHWNNMKVKIILVIFLITCVYL